MKKTFVVLIAAFCMISFAAEFKIKTLADLYASGKYQECINAANSMKASAVNNFQKTYVASSIIRSRHKLTPYANVEAMKSAFEAISKELGVSTSSPAYAQAVMGFYYSFGDHAGAIAYSEGATDIRVKLRRAFAFACLKKFDEAIKLCEEVHGVSPKSYHGIAAINAALSYSKIAKRPEKMFNLLLKAVNSGAIKDPSKIKEYLVIILDTNFDGTLVTAAKIKDLLQSINRRCSKNLVPGSPSKWDDLLVLVRQTLETY